LFYDFYDKDVAKTEKGFVVDAPETSETLLKPLKPS
jgi:hypothetical protein